MVTLIVIFIVLSVDGPLVVLTKIMSEENQSNNSTDQMTPHEKLTINYLFGSTIASKELSLVFLEFM